MSGNDLSSGKVLVLLEHQTSNSFAAVAPQFCKIFAFGETEQAALRNLKNAILNELAEPMTKQVAAPIAQPISAEEADLLRLNLAKQAVPNTVTISYLDLKC